MCAVAEAGLDVASNRDEHVCSWATAATLPFVAGMTVRQIVWTKRRSRSCGCRLWRGLGLLKRILHSRLEIEILSGLYKYEEGLLESLV